MKILLADEKDPRVTCGCRRCGIASAVEKRQFGDGAARPFNSQNLFSTTGRALEDPHLAALNNKQTGAGVALCENDFAFAVVARYRALRQELEFGFSKTVENLDSAKDV